jgi:hypothetical protein
VPEAKLRKDTVIADYHNLNGNYYCLKISGGYPATWFHKKPADIENVKETHVLDTQAQCRQS